MHADGEELSYEALDLMLKDALRMVAILVWKMGGTVDVSLTDLEEITNYTLIRDNDNLERRSVRLYVRLTDPAQ
jgi:hypothetical protein